MNERDERKVQFYRLMGENKYNNAIDYLVENGELIDDMQIGQFAKHCVKFRNEVPIEKLDKLFKILKERTFGKDLEFLL